MFSPRFIRAFVWVLAVAAPAVLMATDGARDDLVRAFDSGIETFDQAQQLVESDAPRARQLFLSAAQQFESVRAAGIESGPLEYNLGNTYLQAGETGRAILHYRRAERLMPHDAKLAANLKEARRRCLTSIPSSRARRALQSVFFWHYETTLRQRMLTAIVFYVSCWVALTARALWHKRWIAVLAAVAGVLTISTGLSVAATDWQDRNSPGGVVLEMDVTVRKGPGSSYGRQFEQPLQPGTEFTRRTSRSGWWEIELPDGNLGWIEASNAELVPESDSRS